MKQKFNLCYSPTYPCSSVQLGSDCLFSFKLRCSWVLVWWVIFYCILDIWSITLWDWVIFKSSIWAGRLWHCPGRGNVAIPHYCQVGMFHHLAFIDTLRRKDALLLLPMWSLLIQGWGGSLPYRWEVMKALNSYSTSSDTNSARRELGISLLPCQSVSPASAHGLHWHHRGVGCYFGVGIKFPAPCYSSFSDTLMGRELGHFVILWGWWSRGSLLSLCW